MKSTNESIGQGNQSSRRPQNKSSNHDSILTSPANSLMSKHLTNRPTNTGNLVDKSDYSGLSDEVRSRIAALETEMESRLEDFVRRERGYNAKIEELMDEIESMKLNKTGWMKHDSKINTLKQMHSQIMNNIELVQDRTARILHEQEKDLLKAFRARLYDVQTELEKEKSKKDDGAGAWIERCRVLEQELEWSKEAADRLERVNQTLLSENNRLKSDFSSHEEDRNFLISQLVTVKKENAKLRAEYSSLESEVDALRKKIERSNEETNIRTPATRNLHSSGTNRYESEEKYKDINIRLKRLLTDERKSLQQLRQTYANELKSRSELEVLLRQCVDDVRKDIAKQKLETGLMSAASNDLSKLYSRQPGMIPIDEFNKQDRNKVIELLLSQEKVISLLYAKTFPMTSYHKANGTSVFEEVTHTGNQTNRLANLLKSDDSGEGSRPTTAGSNTSNSKFLLPPVNQMNVSSSSRSHTPQSNRSTSQIFI